MAVAETGTPALVMSMLSCLLLCENSLAQALTDSSEVKSRFRRLIRPEPLLESSRSRTTFCPLTASRAVTKTCAPVASRARAVSMPMPEEQPVIRMTLSDSFPDIPSSCTMAAAVGLASPGPAVQSFCFDGPCVLHLRCLSCLSPKTYDPNSHLQTHTHVPFGSTCATAYLEVAAIVATIVCKRSEQHVYLGADRTESIR